MKTAKIEDIRSVLDRLKKELHKGIVGQENMIECLTLAILANGHVLLESVPGLAKTRAIQLLARILSLSFKRIQFTPDLLPADIVGTRIYNQSTSNFETKRGPIFANFILADEINRAPAKVQSALLECMQEKQITIGDETFALELPFFVFATQNPVEQEGTYPLPEAQVDRFLIKVVIDYPSKAEENRIVEMVIQETRLPDVSPVADHETIAGLQQAVRQVHIEPKLVDYCTDIVFATRKPRDYGLNIQDYIAYGGSPRASIALAQMARAKALYEGRDHVLPEDIKAVLVPVLQHRIILTYNAQAEGINSRGLIEQIVGSIKVP